MTTVDNLAADFGGMRPARLFVSLLTVGTLLSACASSIYSINLMEVPALYASGEVDPFQQGDPFAATPYSGVLYVTDRNPSVSSSDGGSLRYQNSSGFVLRMGLAKVEVGDGTWDWAKVRDESLSADRPRNYPMRVVEHSEFGILKESVVPLVASAFDGFTDPAQAFRTEVSRGFARSARKTIHIFVPGARSPFENSILLAGEMWHYLGYDGVFIAYAWPARPEGIGLSYFSDAESTILSSRNLRLLLEFLTRETDVEQINLVTYSAGGRIVLGALNQLAVSGATAESSKIGQVILTSSDVASNVFAGYVADGLLNVADRLTIYASSRDLTLGVAQAVLGRKRIGQMDKDGQANPVIKAYLQKNDAFDWINVTSVSGESVPYGHAYFRLSPEVSSDVLTILRHNLSPNERGLVRQDDNPIWVFPKDYAQRVRSRVSSLGESRQPSPTKAPMLPSAK